MFILNGTIQLKLNEAIETPDSMSSIKKTLTNKRRRAMRNIKYDWDCTINYIKLEDYETLKTVYETGTAVTLVNNDLGLNTTVLVDIVSHGFLAGSGTYRSSVNIILTEE